RHNDREVPGEPRLLPKDGDAVAERGAPHAGDGVGVITSSAATSTRYEMALIANAGAIPKAAITSAAAAGPIARARLKVIELSATACVSESRGTSEPTRAICAGFETAVTTPPTPAKPITSHVVAS